MASLKRVVYLVEDEESAQFRYRCKNVCEALSRSGKWRAECFLKSEVRAAEEKIDVADLLVIERQTAKDEVILNLIKKARGLGVKVLFDLDDLIFDYRDIPILMWSTNSKNVFYWSGYFWGIRRIAKIVDGFLCTNEFLGKKLQRSFGKPFGVIPNSLSKEQVEISNKLVSSEEKSHDKKFVMGYFSGSPTHKKDLDEALPEVIEFLKRHDDAVLRVVGYMKFSKDVEKYVDEGRIEFVPFVDFRKLQRLMAEVDVNIAPLMINDFTNCKSELKFFEAAVVETTTIASPTYTFEKAIKDGENGYLAKPGEWLEKLEYLYEHPEESKKVAKAARKYALEHYYGAEFLKEVEEVYDNFAK